MHGSHFGPPAVLHFVWAVGAAVGYLYTHNLGVYCLVEDRGVSCRFKVEGIGLKKGGSSFLNWWCLVMAEAKGETAMKSSSMDFRAALGSKVLN